MWPDGKEGACVPTGRLNGCHEIQQSRRPQCRKRPRVRPGLGQRFQKKWMGLERLQRDEITME